MLAHRHFGLSHCGHPVQSRISHHRIHRVNRDWVWSALALVVMGASAWLVVT